MGIISWSLPREGTGLASGRKMMYIKSTSHCLIFCQRIVGELYTINSEGKFTQSAKTIGIENIEIWCYNKYGICKLMCII